MTKRQKDSEEKAERINEAEKENSMDACAFGWEFDDPPPAWLNKIAGGRKMITDTQKPLYWRILDLSFPTSALSQSDQESARAMISSALQLGHWTDLRPPVDRCLKSLTKLTANQLKRIAKIVKPKGIYGALLEVKSMEDTYELRDDDYLDDDVSYILELLRYTYEMIAQGIPLRMNSERDIDVFVNSHIFSCFNGVVDKHFGEIVSRASRDRRTTAIDALPDAEGYHIDWLFTRHDLGKDLTWGREFSLCERVGSKIENNQKILENSLKVQKTLRDMHRTLVDAVVMAGGGTISKEVRSAIPDLLMPGFLSSRFFLRLILVKYIGSGHCISAELADFDVPESYGELGGILKIARIMLQAKNLLRFTVQRFTWMKMRAEEERFFQGKVLIPRRSTEFSSPKKRKTIRKSLVGGIRKIAK